MEDYWKIMMLRSTPRVREGRSQETQRASSVKSGPFQCHTYYTLSESLARSAFCTEPNRSSAILSQYDMYLVGGSLYHTHSSGQYFVQGGQYFAEEQFGRGSPQKPANQYKTSQAWSLRVVSRCALQWDGMEQERSHSRHILSCIKKKRPANWAKPFLDLTRVKIAIVFLVISVFRCFLIPNDRWRSLRQVLVFVCLYLQSSQPIFVFPHGFVFVANLYLYIYVECGFLSRCNLEWQVG